jgi:hypothetical protein
MATFSFKSQGLRQRSKQSMNKLVMEPSPEPFQEDAPSARRVPRPWSPPFLYFGFRPAKRGAVVNKVDGQYVRVGIRGPNRAADAQHQQHEASSHKQQLCLLRPAQFRQQLPGSFQLRSYGCPT